MLSNIQVGFIARRALERDLDGEELKMLLTIANFYCDGGYCKASNDTLVKAMKKSERTISNLIAALNEKKIINLVFDRHGHRRLIYIRSLSVTKRTYNYEEMSAEQKMFADNFPGRIVDCEVPKGVDMKALIIKIQQSDFLKKADNMTLYSCAVKYYDDIMSGKRWGSVKPFRPSTEREYTREEMNSHFMKVDEIEV